MQVDSWIKVVAGQGGMVAILGLILYVLAKWLAKNWWPNMQAELKQCRTDREAFWARLEAKEKTHSEERREARKEFTDTIRSHSVMVAEIHERTVESLDKTTTALNNLSGQFQALQVEVKKR